LQRIKDIGVRDLDQFYNSAAYHRVSSRYAPHNVYTSLDALISLEATKGWTSSNFTPLVRQAKEHPLKVPAAKSINFGISGAYYNVHYDYDVASNSYKRSEGGAVHVDNETKQQLSPKVVTTGNWSKAQPKDQFVFTDDAGKPMQLDPGQTWISVVDDIAKATYQP
jgi:hypothetical protein